MNIFERNEDYTLKKEIRNLMTIVSEKMCFADIWIDRVSEGKVKWINQDNEEIIKYLNDKYNLAFDGINSINERYTETCAIEIKYWTKSFLKFIDSTLDDFKIKLFNSVFSLCLTGD